MLASYFSPFFSLVIAALVTLVLIPILIASAFGQKIQDVPNARSLHHQPVARIGGVALMIGLLSGWALEFHVLTWWLLVPLLMLFIFSLLDDMRGLPVSQRLMLHIATAAIMVAGSGVMGGSVPMVVLVLLSLVWMTNLFNFMDGSDGLAGGMTFFGFAAYGISSLLSGNSEFAMLNFSIAAAALGFLYYNFYPARVFMGDAGSIPLGFLAAAMGLWGWQQDIWPLWFPVMVFSPFIVDASVTLAKRMVRGEVIWQAHHGHYYQRLVRMGWGHRRTALFYYGLMLCVAVSAVWLVVQPQATRVGGFAVWGGVYVLLALWVDRLWHRHERAAKHNE